MLSGMDIKHKDTEPKVYICKIHRRVQFTTPYHPPKHPFPQKKKKKNGCCVTPLLPALFGYHVTKIYHPLKNSPEKIHALIG